MAYRASPLYDDLSRQEPRERGARRRKFAGYLKTANEIRQTYTQNWSSARQDFSQDGPFADVAAVSNGNEEMILYPSYAKHHTKTKPEAVPGTIQVVPGAGRDTRDSVGTGDAEFWRQQWEQYENDNAVVDVDIHGWLFVPQQGNLTRRQRLMVALARQLVGIPAPSATGRNSASSSVSGSPVRSAFPTEEELAASREADDIVKRGEAEARIANGGGFSELEGRNPISRTSSTDSISARYFASEPDNSAKQTDLDMANQNLMARLRPFMANPLGNVTISAFFYNNHMSRQRTVITDPSGHFTLRAALDFVPTHVRVLSTEKLSIENDLNVIDKAGISLVSDIDDTVKHAGITKGAREIFRNAFTKELDDLTVPGVRECYQALQNLGVRFHYVSNSPWQLYPVLTSFFSLAGLPLGTFHLKQYSGMLQGIFEPVAERKKGSMDRILRDFPERRFILVGDSGEADLEVYTDIVLENPGRVIGIFIRDVITPPNKFFSSSTITSADRGASSMPTDGVPDGLHASKRFPHPDTSHSSVAVPEPTKDTSADTRLAAEASGRVPASGTKPPSLPPRASQIRIVQKADEFEQGNLIDLDDGTDFQSLNLHDQKKATVGPRPETPPKPARLRSEHISTDEERGRTRSGDMKTAVGQGSGERDMHKAIQSHHGRPPPPLPNRRPMTSHETSNTEPAPRPIAHAATTPSGIDMRPTVPPKPTLRPKKSSYAMVADRLSGNWSGSDQDDPVLDKKEELWKRRFERASQILAPKGVTLRTWRVGSDIQEECIAIVRSEMAQFDRASKDGSSIPRKALRKHAP